MGVVVGRDPVVRRDDVAGIGVPGPHQLFEGHEAVPLVLARPARHRQPPVEGRPDRQAAPVQVLHVAVHVREYEVVAGVDPAAHRLVHVVDGPGAQHERQALRPRIRPGGGSLLAGDAVSRRASQDDRPVVRRHDIELGHASTARPDSFAADVGPPPLALPLVLAGVVEPLDVEVVVVGLGVGHAPCHAGVVAEVGEARAAGEGEPQCIEFGAGDVVLVVDVGGVEGPVGVARDERLPRGRAAAHQGPVVAPPLGVREPAHVRCAGRKLRQCVPVAAGVRGCLEA